VYNPNRATVLFLGASNELISTFEDTLGVSHKKLIDTLPAHQRCTYIFLGNAQTLDRILFSSNLCQLSKFNVIQSTVNLLKILRCPGINTLFLPVLIFINVLCLIKFN
jgi:hypothetical protein